MPKQIPIFRPFPQPASPPRARGNSCQRGYGYRWQKYTAWFLTNHPLCEVCGLPATDVDHIKPVTGPDDPLFWDEGNHSAKCHSCHSKKTAREGGRR